MAKNSKVLTAKSAKTIDIKAKETFGISTLVLMENAGRCVAEEAFKVLGARKIAGVFCGNARSKRMLRCAVFCGNARSKRMLRRAVFYGSTRSKRMLRCAVFYGSTRSKRMLRCAVFCGRGNNGGDGFVAARHLLNYGVKADIFLAGRISDVLNEARTNLEILPKLKQKIIEVEEENLHLIKNRIAKYDLIIDALLGVGLQGEVRGIYRDLIGIINTSGAYILSIDIPSGLDATTGKVLGCCVKADKTVTFVAKKRGMVVAEGPKYCGRVVMKDLGIPVV